MNFIDAGSIVGPELGNGQHVLDSGQIGWTRIVMFRSVLPRDMMNVSTIGNIGCIQFHPFIGQETMFDSSFGRMILDKDDLLMSIIMNNGTQQDHVGIHENDNAILIVGSIVESESVLKPMKESIGFIHVLVACFAKTDIFLGS